MRVRGLIAAAVAARRFWWWRRRRAPPTFTPRERSVLYGIASDTWRFYAADVDPVTHLPLDNLGPGSDAG